MGKAEQTAADVPRLMTLDDLMELLGQSRWTVLRRVHAGELRAVRVGDGRNPAYRFRPADVDAYLESRLTAAPAAPAPRPRPSGDPAPGRRRPRRAAGGAG